MQTTFRTNRPLVVLSSAKQWVLACLFALCVASGPAVANLEKLPPLEAIDSQLDMQKFAGDWHVVASIPVGIPFFNDSEAYNYTETYEILEGGRVRMTCAFNQGDFDGERKSFSFTASSASGSNSEWDVQFLWPLKARYMVIYLDDDYENVIVGVPSRRWAWVMSRGPDMNDLQYDNLVSILAQNGFDIAKVRRIPHATATG
jgi:apolipoprotein D and lipocalin family protein